MTIDEAIELQMKIAGKGSDCWKNCRNTKKHCKDCMAEHEQIAEWLEELKSIKDGSIPIIHGRAELELHDKEIRNNAIDDFAEKLSIAFDETDIEEYGFYPKNLVRRVTEELKAGESE